MTSRTRIACVAALIAAHLACAQESRFVTNRPNPRLLPLPREEGAFAFVVYGDRTSGVPAGLKILEQAVADTNLLAPDLVMTVGDLVQGYNDTEEWLRQAAEYKAIMGKLSMPWFPVPGNHDIYYRGRNAPPRQHEGNFEKHFGPLWYAFAHKNCWFVVLHSDEGDPATGKKDFNDPAAQTMSPEQFSWLAATLQKAKGADHVFCFLHHPRWMKGGYGDDWDRVHGLLKGAGNVTAVFAGHIHRMRWDGVKDGIEYFTLAGTGATLPAEVPGAGFLHEMHVVMVRKKRIDVATVPVGAVMDPRKITGEVSDHVLKLTETLKPVTARRIELDPGWGCDDRCEIEITNPVPRPIALLCALDSGDPSFRFSPDHQHLEIPGGGAKTIAFGVRRAAAPLGEGFDGITLSIQCDYLGEDFRVSLPRETFPVGVRLPAVAADPSPEGALALDGKGACLRIESAALALPDGAVTVEAWVRPSDLQGRRGLINKTENSEFGIFVSDGKPTFSFFAGSRYANANAPAGALATGRWQHVAGVFDGQESRIYLDGVLAGSAKGAGERRRNSHPLFIGADPDSVGKPGSFFAGLIDEVRVSKSARYSGDRFQPARRFEPDADTVLLLHLDRNVGPWVVDASPAAVSVDRVGKAACAPIGAGER
jgi:hypothetical protein